MSIVFVVDSVFECVLFLSDCLKELFCICNDLQFLHRILHNCINQLSDFWITIKNSVHIIAFLAVMILHFFLTMFNLLRAFADLIFVQIVWLRKFALKQFYLRASTSFISHSDGFRLDRYL